MQEACRANLAREIQVVAEGLIVFVLQLWQEEGASQDFIESLLLARVLTESWGSKPLQVKGGRW